MNEALCEEFSILKGMHITKKRRLPFTLYYTENFRDEGEVYEGGNDWQSMKTAADAKLLNLVTLVTSETYDTFLKLNQRKHHVLVFNKFDETPGLIKVMSSKYKDKLVIGEVRSD